MSNFQMNASAPASALLITLDDALVAPLVRMREPFLRVVAGAPDGAEVDLSLVRIPDDWLIFPAPDREMNAPATPTASPSRPRISSAFQSAFTTCVYHTAHGCWIRVSRSMSLPSAWDMTLAFSSRFTLRGRSAAAGRQPKPQTV